MKNRSLSLSTSQLRPGIANGFAHSRRTSYIIILHVHVRILYVRPRVCRVIQSTGPCLMCAIYEQCQQKLSFTPTRDSLSSSSSFGGDVHFSTIRRCRSVDAGGTIPSYLTCGRVEQMPVKLEEGDDGSNRRKNLITVLCTV